jgi:hypothetical protein
MEILSLGSTKARKLAVGNLFERKKKIQNTRVDLSMVVSQTLKFEIRNSRIMDNTIHATV